MCYLPRGYSIITFALRGVKQGPSSSERMRTRGRGVTSMRPFVYKFFTRYFVTFIKIKKMFFKLGLHKNLAILTKKHLRWSLFRHRCSPVKFVKFLRTVIFVEHLRYLSCLTYLFLNN